MLFFSIEFVQVISFIDHEVGARLLFYHGGMMVFPLERSSLKKKSQVQEVQWLEHNLFL